MEYACVKVALVSCAPLIFARVTINIIGTILSVLNIEPHDDKIQSKH